MYVTGSNLAYVEERQVQVKCSHQSKTLVLECASFAIQGQVVYGVQIILFQVNVQKLHQCYCSSFLFLCLLMAANMSDLVKWCNQNVKESTGLVK